MAYADLEKHVTKLRTLANGAVKHETGAAPAPEASAFSVPEYPCPDHLWIGPLSDIAATLGRASWEVFLGGLTALGALAHRNVHAQYYGPLYGQFYGLLIKPTGTGKSVCTSTFRALLPEFYSVSGAVQSGPALMPILATIDRSPEGTVERSLAKHGALIIPEWTRLAKNLKIQHSTLLEDMNEIADGIAWNISRSDANKTGGGNVVVKDPMLTICATTTEKLFKEEVTTRMIHSGFVNRYLILPGSFTRWVLYDPDASTLDFESLAKIRDKLIYNPAFGLGRNVWELFEQSALDRFLQWGTPFFEDGIMNSEETDAEIYKRLHTYSLRICSLLAWAERAKAIQLSHVNAVITVIETSKRYLDYLMSESDPFLMPSVRFDIEGKEKVAKKIQKESGKVDLHNLYQGLRRSMRSKDISRWVHELTVEGYVKKVDKRWLTWVGGEFK